MSLEDLKYDGGYALQGALQGLLGGAIVGVAWLAWTIVFSLQGGILLP
jgi:hypothetical protein